MDAMSSWRPSGATPRAAAPSGGYAPSAPVQAWPAPAVGQDAFSGASLPGFLRPVVPQAPYALPPIGQQIAYLQQQLAALEAVLNMFISGLAPAPPTPVPPAPLPPPAPPTQPGPAPQPSTRRTDFVISSFNVLGSSHTVPGGDRPGMASGVERIRSAVKLLDAHDVDVVGFQEFQGDQLREFLRVAGDEYAVYPGLKLGRREVVNSLAWRKDTWEMVKPGHIEIPYFNGQLRKMPVVRLRHKVTGQEAYFANFHNPASTRKHPGQQHWRDVATAKQIDLVNRLKRETGLPVLVTGDMNEREEYYDRMTRATDMEAANSGPKGARPRQMGIDWIFGSLGVKFSNYIRDKGALVKRTSDHPMIVSRARIEGTP